jgi:hypothetical protein
MNNQMTNPLTHHLAKHFRDVHYGGNWTVSCLKDQLNGITWEQATAKVQSFNTIAALVYHIHYFVHAALEVLEGRPLDAHDKFSFDHPPIQNQEDWDSLVAKVWHDADTFASHVEKLSDEKMWESFSGEKYGNWYRNIAGIIEHTHYHLGQIALIKKLVVK